MNTLTILGASGSIGSSAIAFLRMHRDVFAIENIAVNAAWRKAIEIAEEFGCRTVAISDKAAAEEFKRHWRGHQCEILAGNEATEVVASKPVHTVLAAVSGSVGLPSVLAALAAGNRVALANKESLVCGGPALMEFAAKHRAQIIPIDSEHSAIFQCLLAGESAEVDRIVLTASGGPFRTWSPERIERATIQEALRHPVWPMGRKNSLDSATLANKGLEMIEASFLFNVVESNIDVIINPSSLFHSAVQYVDGTMMAMLGHSDMRNAIGYGFTYPKRMPTGVPLLDLLRVKALNFEPVNDIHFPCLDLARQALRHGVAGTLMFNSANEVAGELFLAERIGFTGIPRIIEECLSVDLGTYRVPLHDSLAAIAEARGKAGEISKRFLQ